jgi:hypothetical protein
LGFGPKILGFGPKILGFGPKILGFGPKIVSTQDINIVLSLSMFKQSHLSQRNFEIFKIFLFFFFTKVSK